VRRRRREGSAYPKSVKKSEKIGSDLLGAKLDKKMEDSRQPVQLDDRIVSIDVLRGFVLLGILAANIFIFDLHVAFLDLEGFLNSIEQSSNDLVVGVAGMPFILFMLIFVLNKMMAVFSMLFGAGLLLATERIEAGGRSAFAVHYVRNLLLVGLGLAHQVLWSGDILLLYGVSALFLYPLRQLPPKIFIGLGITLWVSIIFLTPYSPLLELILRAPAMMFIGMGLYRFGVINAQKDPSWYRKMIRRSFIVGLPLCLVATGLVEDQESTSYYVINNLAVPFMAMGYVCLIMWICGEGKLRRVQACLAAAGQMALTNYLTQTLLGMLLIGALNNFRGERVTAFWMMVTMLTIWAIQIMWSVIWMRNFRFGPVEWAWRSATYRRKQPFRK